MHQLLMFLWHLFYVKQILTKLDQLPTNYLLLLAMKSKGLYQASSMNTDQDTRRITAGNKEMQLLQINSLQNFQLIGIEVQKIMNFSLAQPSYNFSKKMTLKKISKIFTQQNQNLRKNVTKVIKQIFFAQNIVNRKEILCKKLCNSLLLTCLITLIVHTIFTPVINIRKNIS